MYRKSLLFILIFKCWWVPRRSWKNVLVVLEYSWNFLSVSKTVVRPYTGGQGPLGQANQLEPQARLYRQPVNRIHYCITQPESWYSFYRPIWLSWKSTGNLLRLICGHPELHRKRFWGRSFSMIVVVWFDVKKFQRMWPWDETEFYSPTIRTYCLDTDGIWQLP